MQLNLLQDSKSENSRVRDAGEAGGGSVAELVALVERMAAEKRSVRQILEAVRAFKASPAIPHAAEGVWLASGSPEWRAWSAYRGRSPPIDRKGGWRFPSRLPPSREAAE
jgi:hypothetical protein